MPDPCWEQRTLPGARGANPHDDGNDGEPWPTQAGGWLWKEKVMPGPEEESWGTGEWWKWQVYRLWGRKWETQGPMGLKWGQEAWREKGQGNSSVASRAWGAVYIGFQR